MKVSGIYQIQSKIKPERLYIGSAVNINERWKIHKSLLKYGKHHSKILQHHYNKYGNEDLQFSILLTCEECNLIQKEQEFINQHIPYFNVCKNAGSRLGTKQTEESNRKNSESNKKAIRPKLPPRTEEHKTNLSKSHLNKKASLETRKKMSASQIGNTNSLGHKHKDESKLKMSVSRIGCTNGFKKGGCSGKDNTFYGKHHTEKAKQLNREKHIGLPSGMKGKHQTEESKQKNREKHLGKVAWNKGKKGLQVAWNKGLKLKMVS